MCIGDYPSRVVERHGVPEVEVADWTASPGCGAGGWAGEDAVPPWEAAPELLLPPLTVSRRETERCLIERSVNSARVSLVFFKEDPLAAWIVRRYMHFMEQRASSFHVLRRRPVHGYDVSFLITSREVAAMGRERIIHHIIAFAQGVDDDIAAIKTVIDERAKAAAEDLLSSTAALR